MATVSTVSKPGYIYDANTDTWYPIGVGSHTHSDAIPASVNVFAGKNGIINGAFNVWQRGTSIAIAAASAAYTADRWQVLTGASAASTISRQTTSDTTNLPFIQYCARVQRNSGQTGATQHAIYQSFESSTSVPFVGKTITLSFYARAGANFSPTSGILNAAIYSGTGTDQNIGVGGYTGSVAVASSAPSLTTTWTRYTVTGTVGATATELTAYFYWTTTGTAGTNDYFEITGVQLEVGSTATPFQTASGTIGGELALCQRYYFRASVGSIGNAIATSTTAFEGNLPLPVAMRITPATLDSSATRLSDGGAVTNTATLLLNAANSNLTSAYLTGTVASGLTAFRPYFFSANAGYYGFSAEL